MIVLEGQEPLGSDAHEYYGELIGALRSDPEHVEHVQDLWGDRLTASSVTSPDGKATYVQLESGGRSGHPAGRRIGGRRARHRRPVVTATGRGSLCNRCCATGFRYAAQRKLQSILKITAVTVVIIFILALPGLSFGRHGDPAAHHGGYRAGGSPGHRRVSGRERSLRALHVRREHARVPGHRSRNRLRHLFFGRYQEARQAGEDREQAYYSMYRGVTPVVLASGLTIAGAILCLTFTRLPYFETMGIPCAIGMAAAVAVAITLVPRG